MHTNNINVLKNVYLFELRAILGHLSEMVRSLGHRPLIVKRVVIGSQGGWKLSTIFML